MPKVSCRAASTLTPRAIWWQEHFKSLGLLLSMTCLPATSGAAHNPDALIWRSVPKKLLDPYTGEQALIGVAATTYAS